MAQPGIPGLDVIEERARPAYPRSKEATAWLNSRGAPAAPAPAPSGAASLRGPISELAYKAGQATQSPGASRAANIAGLLGKVGGTGLALRSASKAVDDFQAGDGAGATLNGLSAIAGTASAALPLMSPAGLAATAGGAGMLVGDQIYQRGVQGNEALTDGIGGAINAGLRLFGGGVDTTAMDQIRANGVSGGAPVGGPARAPSAGNGLPAVPPGADPQGLLARPENQTPATSASVPGAGQTMVAPGAVRDGNTYSDALPGATLRAGYSGNVGGFTSDAPPPAADSAGLNAPAAGFRTTSGLTNEAQTANLRRDMASMISNPSRYGGTRALAAALPALQAQITELEGRDQLGVQGLREQGETARAAARSRAELAANERSANVTMRGQDMALLGQQISAKTAKAQSLFDQMNKDRQFQLDAAKYGTDQAKVAFDQREAGYKSFRDWAGATFTTRDKDGKTVPDATRAAAFETAATQTLGNMITRLQQKGDPASMAKAKELATRGVAGMDAEDRAQMHTLFLRSERFSATRGLSPMSATGAVSNDLNDFSIAGQQNGLVQKRFVTAGGQTIPQNDLRYTEPANAVLPDLFKTPTSAYGPTLQEQQALREQAAKQGLR